MSSLWFDEPNEEPAHKPFDPWKKREDKLKEDQNQRTPENSLATSSNNPHSRKNSKSGIYLVPIDTFIKYKFNCPVKLSIFYSNITIDNEDDWSQFSSMCGPPKVTRNMSVIPMNHPAQFLYPDSGKTNLLIQVFMLFKMIA